jgi:phosphoglycolate phosphatase-like HAD superfamily hydrolase
VARVKAAGQTPVVVFDLDDTLFETRTRSAVIIREFAQANGNDPRLLAAEPRHTRFGLEQTLEQVGLTQAEITGDLGRAIRRFWSPRFFNGTHYVHDTPIAGAAAYVNRLHGLGARIVYLTGRKTQARQPSLDALQAAGFPIDPATTTIYVKPDVAPGQPKLETSEWKGQTARTEIVGMGTVVAAFDNEPANVNALRQALAEPTRVVFLDTLYADDAPAVAPGTSTITDYR